MTISSRRAGHVYDANICDDQWCFWIHGTRDDFCETKQFATLQDCCDNLNRHRIRGRALGNQLYRQVSTAVFRARPFRTNSLDFQATASRIRAVKSDLALAVRVRSLFSRTARLLILYTKTPRQSVEFLNGVYWSGTSLLAVL